MTRLFYVLLSSLFILFFSNLNAQTNEPSEITDEMTADPEQNAAWRTGQGVYSAKPKNMWELGIHAGPAFVSGDVEAPFPAGYGFGLHLRKAINYTFSIRGDITYQSSKGYDARAANAFSSERVYYQNVGTSPALAAYAGPGAIYHRNYRANILSGTLEGLINMGNVLFHKPSNNTNFYFIAGIGLNMPKVYTDLLDGNGNAYSFEGVAQGDNQTKELRRASRDNLKNLLDGDFETRGGIEKDFITLPGIDHKTLIPHFNAGIGLSKKLSRRINLGIEHRVMLSDNDLLDGYEYRTSVDETVANDFAHYTSIRLGINLGSFEKRIEPLYWVNPLDGPLTDIAELKQRPKFDLTDSDGDGVIDMTDQEINTPAGCPVDTRGVTLDSDGDSIADCKDQEPYSPPGYEVDANGVAQVPDSDYITEDELVNIINTRGGLGNLSWFLPMVHFDLDKYYIKPEFYGSLHHVATVMNTHPDLKIVAHGYTDNRAASEYNNVLSYNRANAAINYLVENYNLPRSRFILSYGGEQTPIVKNLKDSHNISSMEEYQHYINRRVEFRVATATDTDMSRPSGPEAGRNTPGSSRPGSKYSGNRNSGY